MKKAILFIFFLLFNSTFFGQQFLWSTLENNSVKHVPLENITEEVLKFYDHYDQYHDGAGYSKINFLKTIEKYGDSSESWKNFKQMILKTETLTVFAMRSNTGKGSAVFVICVNKENVNYIIFSNTYEIASETIVHIDSEREKFTKWLQTLLE